MLRKIEYRDFRKMKSEKKRGVVGGGGRKRVQRVKERDGLAYVRF